MANELEGKPVEFTATAGPPLKLTVTALDGKKHNLLVQVAIMQVSQLDKEDDAGNPKFGLAAAMTIQVVK